MTVCFTFEVRTLLFELALFMFFYADVEYCMLMAENAGR